MTIRFRPLAVAIILSVPFTPGQAQAPAQPLKRAPRPTQPAIRAEDLMTRLYIFADDSMEGRQFARPGNFKGTAYLAGELRKLGLEPAGENGTFFQEVVLARETFDSTSTLAIGRTTLAPWVDFVAEPRVTQPQRSYVMDGMSVVYGGDLRDSASFITPARAAGKVVIALSDGDSTRLKRLQSAAAYLIVTETFDSQAIARLRNPTARFAPPLRTQSTKPLAMWLTRRAAETVLGRRPEEMVPGTVVGTMRGHIRFRRETLPEGGVPARNVVAIVRGTDPSLRHTYVAIGAHNDHEGVETRAVDHDSLRAWNLAQRRLRLAHPDMKNKAWDSLEQSIVVNVDSLRRLRPARRDSIKNGADDDGSGSVALLEIAEALARLPAKPKRSILFVFHTGEEAGLLGSRYFTRYPTVPIDSIVTQVNIDMIGRGSVDDTPEGGPNMVMAVGASRLSTELGKIVEAVNTRKAHNLRFDYTWDAPEHPEGVYSRSDHYEYASHGIPVVFFFTGLHADYHEVTDEPQYIDYPHMTKITKYVYDLLLELGTRPARPVVDRPAR